MGFAETSGNSKEKSRLNCCNRTHGNRSEEQSPSEERTEGREGDWAGSTSESVAFSGFISYVQFHYLAMGMLK
jgi:hypothetical protein